MNIFTFSPMTIVANGMAVSASHNALLHLREHNLSSCAVHPTKWTNLLAVDMVHLERCRMNLVSAVDTSVFHLVGVNELLRRPHSLGVFDPSLFDVVRSLFSISTGTVTSAFLLQVLLPVLAHVGRPLGLLRGIVSRPVTLPTDDGPREFQPMTVRTFIVAVGRTSGLGVTTGHAHPRRDHLRLATGWASVVFSDHAFLQKPRNHHDFTEIVAQFGP